MDRTYNSRPGFMVVYGTRRIGKTRLLREWLGRRGVKILSHIEA
ncbi:MAG: ATP-binding protein [Aeropyrum sp.]|nr:ATP-binding protein [Aeropyrum sp.]